IAEYIPVSYGSAEDLVKLLTDDAKTGSGGGGGGGQNQSQHGFLSPRGSVTFDRRTNTLLINDIPKKVQEVKALVALLDRPVDQVLIEARIVIATESFARDLGARLGLNGAKQGDSSLINYGGNLEATNQTSSSIVSTSQSNAATEAAYLAAIAALPAGTNPNTIAPPQFKTPTITRGLNVNLPVANASGGLAFTILNGGHLLDLELTAMQTEGRGEIISNPRVITSNQKEAVIQQGDEVGYVTQTPSSAGGVPTPNVQFKDVLLELKVTPTITNDNRVYMSLGVKKDEISGFVNTSIGSVPQIAKRNITTAVLVDSGQTVVIGGVYEFKSQEDVNKVPFLGDLPFLGNLFRSKNKSTSKAEMLIFVTPKILQVKPRSIN
ncbi:MAG: type IV pilus secretin PilQ, partial [Lysobacteraceae bacterium]